MASKTPLRLPQSHITDEVFDAICASVALHGGKYKACEVAGVNYTTVAELITTRERRGDFTWREKWSRAYQMFVESLEREAWRRAHEGVSRPIYQGGKLVGTTTEYSDGLLGSMLKAHSPKYRDRMELSGSVEVNDKPDAFAGLSARARRQIRDIIQADMEQQAMEMATPVTVLAIESQPEAISDHSGDLGQEPLTED